MDYIGNAALFNTPTNDDLVVKWGESKWYCHKCIVFSTSTALQRMCESNPEDTKRDQIVLDRKDEHWPVSKSTIHLLLRTMYEDNETVLFGQGVQVNDYVNLSSMARSFGLVKLGEATLRALRHRLEKELVVGQLGGYIDDIREAGERFGENYADLVALANAVEVERMGELLLDDDARCNVSRENIQKWYALVGIEIP